MLTNKCRIPLTFLVLVLSVMPCFYTGCSSPAAFVTSREYASHAIRLEERLEPFRTRSRTGSLPYTVYRTDASSGNGHAILLIHNLGASSVYWVNQLEYLSGKYDCVAPDLIGFGHTAKPDIDYSIASFVSFLKGVMQDQCPDCRWTVAGHSFGGILAMELAYRMKDKVEGLVLVSSQGYDPFQQDAGGVSWAASCIGAAGGLCMKPVAGIKLGLESDDKLKARIKTSMYPLFYLPGQMVSDELVNITFHQSRMRGAKRALKRSNKHFFPYTGRSVFSKISCPVLIVWGTYDHYSAGYAYEFYARFEDAQVELINDARHVPQFERPEQFNQGLESFLQYLSSKQVP